MQATRSTFRPDDGGVDGGDRFVTAGLPSFFVVGAPRAGTTALYRYLQQHPVLYLSTVKEPSFFACGEAAVEEVGRAAAADDDVALARSVLTWDRYRSLYAPAPDGAVLGDSSPTYLYLPQVPPTLARHVPDARIVAVLRQPAERAWSHLNADAGGRPVDPADLLTALAAEEAAPRTTFVASHDYLRPGLYGLALEGWLRHFPREQVLLLPHDELLTDTEATVRRIFDFVGVDPHAALDTAVRYNAAGPTARLSVTSVLRRLRRHAHLLPDGLHRRAARVRAQVANRERRAVLLPDDVRAEVTERWFAADLDRLEAATGFVTRDWR